MQKFFVHLIGWFWGFVVVVRTISVYFVAILKIPNIFSLLLFDFRSFNFNIIVFISFFLFWLWVLYYALESPFPLKDYKNIHSCPLVQIVLQLFTFKFVDPS